MLKSEKNGKNVDDDVVYRVGTISTESEQWQRAGLKIREDILSTIILSYEIYYIIIFLFRDFS